MPAPTKTPATRPLGHHEHRYWPADRAAPPGGQRGGAYEVFVPDPIATREFALDGEAVGAVAEATKALGHLNHARPQLASLAALARNLLRAESAASSRIEGVEISHKRLARAAYARDGQRRGDNRAAEVLGNVEAMERAIDLGTNAEPFTIAGVQDIHRKLLRFTDDRRARRRTAHQAELDRRQRLPPDRRTPTSARHPSTCPRWWRTSADSSPAPTSPP